MSNWIRLRSLGIAMIFAAFATGVLVTAIWSWSTRAWHDHLMSSYVIGVSLHEALRTGSPLPDGIKAERLSDTEARLSASGDFSAIPSTPRPAIVTNVSIARQSGDPAKGQSLKLGIMSDSLHYAVSEISTAKNQSPAQKFGNVTRLVATYCSQTLLFASLGNDQWWRIDGNDVWGCAAAPRDLRLLAVIIAGVILAALGTVVADTSSYFDRFATTLRNRRHLGGPDSYATTGPGELREIVSAVNTYLEAERDQLSRRAMILSGVSHDLGMPATRLRLRTALIKDPELREKIDTDIDSMTGMIESVLTFTRTELNTETPRQMSLTSLVEAIIDDYRDMGKPVHLKPQKNRAVAGGRSVFSSSSGQAAMPETQSMLVTVRPISLKRGLTNLIDNALKYGRRATIELGADAEFAQIIVEDEGSGMTAEEMEQVIAPFKRGSNTRTIDGSGLGLTIVAGVATQHGGALSFETGQHGLRACLKICRA